MNEDLWIDRAHQDDLIDAVLREAELETTLRDDDGEKTEESKK
jgi:hypothetical protein